MGWASCRQVVMAVVMERGRWARGAREGSRDLRLSGTPCVGGNGCRSERESVLQESWRVAGVSQQGE